MEKSFNEAMDFRHACKVFDENKKISERDIIDILEAGRKSPSSFGMEPWKFLVIKSNSGYFMLPFSGYTCCDRRCKAAERSR